MKTKTLSLSTILGFLGLILMIHAMNSYADTGTISCETAYGEKKFTISANHISFHKEDESGISRSISSAGEESVRTQKKHLGFTKTLYIEGNKYKISIKNAREFSEVEDYLSITGPKGHEMTFPLTCHSV